MKFFDPQLLSEARTDDDLDNLLYFGTEQVLCLAHAPRRFEGPFELLAYYERLLSSERQRMERAGLTPCFALGVHPAAAPRRTFHELWRDLPMLLSEPRVVAIGELGIAEATSREYGLLEHQLKLARELNLPACVRLSSRGDSAIDRQILGCVRRSGLPRERVLLSGARRAQLLDLASLGFAVIAELAGGDRLEGWPEGLLQSLLGAPGKVMLSAGLREGPGDVLALNRASVTLGDWGFDAHIIDRLVRGEAASFFQR